MNFKEYIPIELKNKIVNSTWKKVTIGKSGAYIYMISEKENNNSYLKIVPRKFNMSLEREVNILKWLENKLPVPKVLLYCIDTKYEYLLMSEIKGIMACNFSNDNDIKEIIKIIANALKKIHSIDIKKCPFDQRLNIKIKEAKNRILKGLVNEEDFDDNRKGERAINLFKKLLIEKPDKENLVFTHGDYCLPNIIINNGSISGFIDWGRGGIADRYQDLALAARSIEYNFDRKWIPLLFKEYGIDGINYEKIEYYKLLDEFF